MPPMQTSKLGLLLALALVVAGGLWFGFGGSGLGGLGGGLDEVDAGLRPVTDELPLRKPDATTPSTDTSEKAGREELIAAPDPSGADAPALPEALLVGRVVDPDGRGLPGARVFAASGQSWVLAPLDIEPEGLRNWVEPHIAETDAEGRFVFEEGLEPGPLRLAVRAAGFGPLYLDGKRLSEQRPHDSGDLELTPGARLAGRVVDRRGKGVADALILHAVERGIAGARISVPGRGVPLTRTADDGAFVVDTIGDGPWSLLVEAAGYQIHEESGRVEAAGSAVEGLLFVLEQGDSIRGSIKSLPAGMAPRLRVEARPKSADRNRSRRPSEGEVAVSRRVRRGDVTAEGAFVVAGLVPAVEYMLTVWEQPEADEEDFERVSSIEAVAAWSGARVDLHYAPEAALLFRVVDSGTGEPIEDFVAWAGLGDRTRVLRPDGEDENVALHHPDGRARYAGLRPAAAGSRAKLRLRATGYKDFEREGIALARGQEHDLGEIALDRAPVARVTVLDDKTGEPIEGAHVLLAKEDDRNVNWFLRSTERAPWDNRSFRFGVTGAQGIAILPLIEGERARLYAVAESHVSPDPVDVPTRAREDFEETFRLARGGTVIVKVLAPDGEPLADANVEHRQEDVDPERGSSNRRWNADDGPTTDPDGIVRFDHLPAGRHSFRVTADGSTGAMGFRNGSSDDSDETGWETVTVVEEETEELTLEGEQRANLAGLVTEARVALAGASLKLRAKDKPQRYVWAGTDKYASLSEHDGRFAFQDVAVGEYVLAVTHPDRRMGHEEEITIGPGDNRIDVELPLAIIEGRVVDPTGTPIGGLEVRVSPVVRGRSSWRGGGGGSLSLVEDDKGGVRPDWRSGRRRTARTSPDGTYALRGVAASEALRVSVSGRYVVPGTSEELTIAPDEIRTGVDFVLERAGVISVRLAGAQRGQFNIEAILTEGEQTYRKSTRVWGSRSSRISSLRPGTWDITVKQRTDDQWVAVATTSAEVKVDETASVTVEIP
ncbi:MAG: carboxypeptidase regulatory-like domain-containing protein [bacterium]|nr:carboxypeptidase regulatory-like domain-containing protein [bacterium]